MLLHSFVYKLFGLRQCVFSLNCRMLIYISLFFISVFCESYYGFKLIIQLKRGFPCTPMCTPRNLFYFCRTWSLREVRGNNLTNLNAIVFHKTCTVKLSISCYPVVASALLNMVNCINSFKIRFKYTKQIHVIYKITSTLFKVAGAKSTIFSMCNSQNSPW